jgi:serine/threonine protein kinase
LQIASGLQYLHDNNIAHLDLKSGNVLVWKFPSPNVSYRERVRIAGEVAIKLADYGISKISTYYGARLKGFRGTPGYAAPELVQCKGQEVDVRKGDVFSFGMTLSELMTFSPPFQNNREQMDVAGIQSALWRGDRPSFSVKVV